ncbi:MAG: hypothetical protein ACFB22_11570 [Rhodothalassiaceae bacterium]
MTGGQDDPAPRKDRLAEALRANLKRRKEQARQRRDSETDPPGDRPKAD